MRKIFLLTFILVCFFGINAQTRKKSNPSTLSRKLAKIPHYEKLVYEYDKFKERTSVYFTSQIFNKFRAEGWFFLFSRFEGKIPPKEPIIIITFTCINKTKFYGEGRSLIILSDNNRIVPNEVGYDDSEMVGFDYAEKITYLLKLDELKMITTGKNVEMQLKVAEFSLDRKQLLLIRDFYNRLVPSSIK